MARRRWIEYRGQVLTLTAWAAAAGISPGTLAYRLDRRGLPMARALATGVLDRRDAGRLGKAASRWGSWA